MLSISVVILKCLFMPSKVLWKLLLRPPRWGGYVIGPIANLKGHYFQPSLSVSLSACLSACVSLTGTSTLQR